jgi:hypothetical protein
VLRFVLAASASLAAIAAVGSLTGCTGEIAASPDTSSADASSPDAGMSPLGDPDAVARAQEWVDAKLPYCQAPNHAHDADTACSSICTRPDNPAWDAYRSDCSGLVSYAWALPAPGHTTATLAPYNTSVSHAIAAADLLPGDAINNDHHTMLFADWVVAGTKARFLEEPACSSSQPYARETIVNVTLTGQTLLVEGRGTYTSIRHDR